MEFKEKVLLNARKFARRFSITKGSHNRSGKGTEFGGEDKENQCRLTRSQSGKHIFHFLIVLNLNGNAIISQRNAF